MDVELQNHHRQQQLIEPGRGQRVMQSALYAALALAAIFVAALPALLH